MGNMAGWYKLQPGMAARIRLAKVGENRKNGFNRSLDWAVNPGAALWQPGWTHYGTAGQTLARLHTQTRAVEIKDGNEWIRCASGSDAYFTPDFALS
jgi:hypothetical protein